MLLPVEPIVLTSPHVNITTPPAESATFWPRCVRKDVCRSDDRLIHEILGPSAPCLCLSDEVLERHLPDLLDEHCDEQRGAAEGASGADSSTDGEGADTGYLAQHPLLEQIPELRADVAEPVYCALGEGHLQSVNAWFGPAGTVRRVLISGF